MHFSDRGNRKTPDTARALRWRMLVIATLAQNTVTGMIFGSFGIVILASEAHLGVGRGVASLGLGFVLLANGLVSNLVARLVRWASLRFVMMSGAALCGAGFLALAYANHVAAMLAACGLLIGPGLALCGVIPNNALIGNWFERARGRALGVVNMPFGVLIVPITASYLLTSVGLQWTYIALAAPFAVLILLLMFVIDTPNGREPPSLPADVQARTGSDQESVLKTSFFWLLVLACGLITAGAITKSLHLAPLIVERGMSAERAAQLLAISGGTGVLGSPIFGWLAEKKGGGFSLAAGALLQGAAWVILLLADSFALLLVDAVIVGACAGGYVVSTVMLISSIYGMDRFTEIYGKLSPLTLPFLFGAAPLTGYLHDLSGNYASAFLLQIAAFAVAGACAIRLSRAERRVLRRMPA